VAAILHRLRCWTKIAAAQRKGCTSRYRQTKTVTSPPVAVERTARTTNGIASVVLGGIGSSYACTIIVAADWHNGDSFDVGGVAIGDDKLAVLWKVVGV
jgi:hypothetical protein